MILLLDNLLVLLNDFLAFIVYLLKFVIAGMKSFYEFWIIVSVVYIYKVHEVRVFNSSGKFYTKLKSFHLHLVLDKSLTKSFLLMCF